MSVKVAYPPTEFSQGNPGRWPIDIPPLGIWAGEAINKFTFLEQVF